MSHSHLPVQHLLKQVETYRARRDSRRATPAWVADLIGKVADLFEPLTEDGRVGYESQWTDDGWILGVYLGGTEIVGGPKDGTCRPSDFHFDLLPLLDLFTDIERLRWNAFPQGSGPHGSSLVMVAGRIDEQPVRLRIYAAPPPGAKPGFRQFPDGRREPV